MISEGKCKERSNSHQVFYEKRLHFLLFYGFLALNAPKNAYFCGLKHMFSLNFQLSTLNDEYASRH